MTSDRTSIDLSQYEIRRASVAEVGPLPEIEVQASAIFPDEDIAPELRESGLPLSYFECAAKDGRVWIAHHEPTGLAIGFAVTTVVDGSAHLYEMDVHPDHARRGIGGALVESLAIWARDAGFPSLTLTTFRHLSWNAPFYRRHGFVELDEVDLSPDSELAALLVHEAESGLDPEKRVAMRRNLLVGPAA